MYIFVWKLQLKLQTLSDSFDQPYNMDNLGMILFEIVYKSLNLKMLKDVKKNPG